MLTGDSDRTAAAIAAEVGVDDYRAEVLPEDKASYVAARARRRAAPSSWWATASTIPRPSPRPTLGIAISDGAAIAREIADITVAADSLCTAGHACGRSAMELMKRIRSNYRFVIGFNGTPHWPGCLSGILPPATSALLHNVSTIGISLRSMTNLLSDLDRAELKTMIEG